MSDERIGFIGHVWKKAGSASVDLVGASLHVGDRIRIRGHNHEFEQFVESLEVNHVAREIGSPGELVAISVQEPVSERDEVWRISPHVP